MFSTKFARVFPGIGAAPLRLTPTVTSTTGKAVFAGRAFSSGGRRRDEFKLERKLYDAVRNGNLEKAQQLRAQNVSPFKLFYVGRFLTNAIGAVEVHRKQEVRDAFLRILTEEKKN